MKIGRIFAAIAVLSLCGFTGTGLSALAQGGGDLLAGEESRVWYVPKDGTSLTLLFKPGELPEGQEFVLSTQRAFQLPRDGDAFTYYYFDLRVDGSFCVADIVGASGSEDNPQGTRDVWLGDWECNGDIITLTLMQHVYYFVEDGEWEGEGEMLGFMSEKVQYKLRYTIDNDRLVLAVVK